jgi:inhibitor of cysteine peptidase
MRRFQKRQGLVAVVLVLIIVGAAMASAGCGSQASANGGPVKLTDADNGKAITVKVGDDIQVILTGNPTTGYSWTATLSDKDKAVLQQQGDPVYAQGNANPSVVGAGGAFTFTFKAAAKGQVVLKFDYARPWETGVAPIQTYTATITVE